MKSIVSWLVAVGLVASFAASPALATVFLEDHFTAETLGIPDTVGTRPWLLVAGGTIPLVDGRAIFDPSENNPSTTTDPVTGEEIPGTVGFGVDYRFIPPVQIPPASSGMMLELTGEVKDRGADSTPMYNPFHADPEQFNATHSDIQMSQFRLFSSPAEIYLPTFGSPFVKFRPIPDETPELTGTYSTGFCHEGGLASGTCSEDPRNLEVDSGVPLPGFGESHWIRSRIRSLPTGLGNEAIVDISTDGGTSYFRIGRVLFPYDGANGTDVENPGLFNQLAINSPGVLNCCRFDQGNRFDEGEYSLGFIKFESTQLAPADKRATWTWTATSTSTTSTNSCRG